MYSGDIQLGDTIDIKFTTRQFSTGAPFILAGSPVVSAYVGNNTTEITAGITLSANFDSVTGLNNVRVVASGGNGFAAQTNISLVITTGTVDSVSVVGEVVGSFSIQNRPVNVNQINGVATTSVTAVNANVGTTQPLNFTGTAGSALVKGDAVDWAGGAIPSPTVPGVPNVNAKTWNDLTTVDLPLAPTTAGRTLDVSTGGEAGLDWANIGSPTTVVGLSGTTIKAVTDGVALASTAIQAIWDALTSALTTAGSIGKLIVDNLNATITSRMATYSQPTGFLAATFPSGTIANTTNITAGTMTTTTNLTNAPTVGDLTSTMKGSVEDAVWDAVLASHTASGSTGEALGAAGAAGDPWITNLPGSYTGIQAGKLVGDALDAAISTRAVAGDAMALTSGERNSVADALLDRTNGIETGSTPRGAMRLMLAALAGKLSGAAGTTVTFRNAVADSKDRIVATVTADGNRTAVTTDQT